MPGQQEQRDELDRRDQPDPREVTLDLSRLIERVQGQVRADSGEHQDGTAAADDRPRFLARASAEHDRLGTGDGAPGYLRDQIAGRHAAQDPRPAGSTWRNGETNGFGAIDQEAGFFTARDQSSAEPGWLAQESASGDLAGRTRDEPTRSRGIFEPAGNGAPRGALTEYFRDRIRSDGSPETGEPEEQEEEEGRGPEPEARDPEAAVAPAGTAADVSEALEIATPADTPEPVGTAIGEAGPARIPVAAPAEPETVRPHGEPPATRQEERREGRPRQQAAGRHDQVVLPVGPDTELPSELPAEEAAAAPRQNPVPGSVADLTQRLRRLPFGHPSSPYHVDGEPKPPPPRLRHLELAPQAQERVAFGAGTGTWASRSGDLEDGWSSQPQDVVALAGAARPAGEPGGGNAQPAGPFAANGGDDGGSSARRPVPRTEPDGSWVLGSLTLTTDQVRIAEEAYELFRAAEGRDLFGRYGDAGLTVQLRQVAAEMERGSLADDTEQRALLDPDEFKARFAGLLRQHPDRLPERLVRRVPGALSYRFVFDDDRYSADTWLVQDALQARGYPLLARKNEWSSPHNKCILTMWHDPANDLPFEVQFHTRDSLEAQRLALTSAMLMSDTRIPIAERVNLRSDIAAAWAVLPAPPGNSDIQDYRMDSPGAAP